MTIRLISAGIGIAIALLILFLHNTILLPIAVAVVSMILMLEYLRANRLFRYRLSSASAMLYAAVLPFVTVGLAARFKLFVMLCCLCGAMADYVLHQTEMPAKHFFAFVSGMFLIPGAISCALILHNAHEQHGVAYIVLALGGAWFADSGAYFAGSYLGRTKLCPRISPKKTVEGFFGGIAACVLFFLIFNGIYSVVMQVKGVAFGVNWFSTIILGAVIAVLGTLGDLVASVLKRQLGLKDYGTIMPGHGGLLDRFDSVLLVLPFFCAYVQAASFFNIR